MPSLQQELTAKLKDLKFDDEEEQTNNSQPSPNKTRAVFEYYRDNPMSLVNECADALAIESSRVAAMSLQLFNRNLLSRSKRGQESYRYSATEKEYPETSEVRKAALIKAREVRSSMPKKAKTKKAKSVAAKPEPAGFSAAVLVGGLTPFQAKAVYDELAKLFGG